MYLRINISTNITKNTEDKGQTVVANSFHRSGRAPLVSPDEAYRSAQSRASKLAQQRRSAASRNAPNPANKKGNISGGSRKVATRPKETPRNPQRGNTPSNASRPSQADTAPIKRAQTAPTGATPPPLTTPAPKTSPAPAAPPNSAPRKIAKENPQGKKGVGENKRATSVPNATSNPQKKTEKNSPARDNKENSSTSHRAEKTQSHRRKNAPSATVTSSAEENNTQKTPVSKLSLFDAPAEKKKHHRGWLLRKPQAEVSTDIEESEYDVVSSYDDLGEVKEAAHLSDEDTDKIIDTYAGYKVQQQVRSNGKKVEKLPRIYVVVPRKKEIFKVLTSVWSMLLIVALAGLSVYGYTVYKDAELGKERDAAYAEGVKSSSKDPDISSLMKMDSQQLSGKILASQGANFPPNAKVDTFSLAGWTYPGGSQKESRAEIDFCYSGDGQKKSKGSVFFYTPDAVSTAPDWSVDTISLTQTPCEGAK